MRLMKGRVLLIATCILVSLLITNNYGQTKGRKRSSVSSTQESKTGEWRFWHITKGNHLADEFFDSKRECKDAEEEWSRSSGFGRIAFRCAGVTNKLLNEARARCKRKEAYACEWKESIQAILDRQSVH